MTEGVLSNPLPPKANDLVLDPFLVSGQVVVVSKMNGRNHLGFEIVKEYFEFAKERLENNIYRIKSAGQTNVAFAYNKSYG